MYRDPQHLSGPQIGVAGRRMASQHLMEEIKDTGIRGTPALLGLGQRPFDVALVLGADVARRHISAVDREGCDDLFEGGEYPVQGEVAGPPTAHRQAMKLAGEHVHLAREVDLNDALLAGVEHLVEAFAAIGDTAVELGHRALARGIDKKPEDLTGEIVTSGPHY